MMRIAAIVLLASFAYAWKPFLRNTPKIFGPLAVDGTSLNLQKNNDCLDVLIPNSRGSRAFEYVYKQLCKVGEKRNRRIELDLSKLDYNFVRETTKTIFEPLQIFIKSIIAKLSSFCSNIIERLSGNSFYQKLKSVVSFVNEGLGNSSVVNGITQNFLLKSNSTIDKSGENDRYNGLSSQSELEKARDYARQRIQEIEMLEAATNANKVKVATEKVGTSGTFTSISSAYASTVATIEESPVELILRLQKQRAMSLDVCVYIFLLLFVKTKFMISLSPCSSLLAISGR